MSKKFNVDEQSGLVEPIEIIIDAKQYSVGKVSTDLMDKVIELSKSSENIDAPRKQLALLLDVNEDEFKLTDVRKIGSALNFITTSIQGDINSKKSLGTEVKQ